jgi:hypothetical protein
MNKTVHRIGPGSMKARAARVLALVACGAFAGFLQPSAAACADVSLFDDTDGCIAASVFGNAHGTVVAVSVFGDAEGHFIAIGYFGSTSGPQYVIDLYEEPDKVPCC